MSSHAATARTDTVLLPRVMPAVAPVDQPRQPIRLVELAPEVEPTRRRPRARLWFPVATAAAFSAPWLIALVTR